MRNSARVGEQIEAAVEAELTDWRTKIDEMLKTIKDSKKRLGHLKFLLLSLSITPFRRWTGWVWLLRFRRMLGLFAFFYILLHFLCYAILDQSLDVALIIEDVIERPYITIGMTGLLLLIPLAATSTKGMMKRLGRRWQKLHRLVYVIGVLGVWHFYWQVKLDTLDATIYALILVTLLMTRVFYWHRAR